MRAARLAAIILEYAVAATGLENFLYSCIS